MEADTSANSKEISLQMVINIVEYMNAKEVPLN